MPTQISQTVTKVTWKTFDGKVFDTEAEAEEYEETIGVPEMVNKEVLRLHQQGKRRCKSITKSFEARPDRKLLIIDTDKYDSDYYIVKNADEFLIVYWRIFSEDRFGEYGPYRQLYDEEKKIAEAILESADKFAALAFIDARSDYEYEKVEEVVPLEVKL